MDALCEAYPELLPFVFQNKFKKLTVDFANPKAVKALNTALLFKHYNINFWDFPETNLCPPIPGRLDYMHYLADLLESCKIHKQIKVLDIGTGASCIYPILGHLEYKWNFVGVDIDADSLKHAQRIINKNNLSKSISLRFQSEESQILKGVIGEHDMFTATMCNPPFFTSQKEALEATSRKLKGLNSIGDKVVRNFAGTQNELCYKGGEKAFIHNYLYESTLFKTQCIWFTTLVSKKDLLKGIYASLTKLKATNIKTINMAQGNKMSRIVAWTFR